MTRTLVQTEPEDITVRDMRTEDLREIVAIERNAHVSPWSRLSFEESLTKNYVCRVVVLQDQVVGYHVCCPIVDELHVLNVVTAPHRRGFGLGHCLMRDIVAMAGQSELLKIFLEVRASNEVAQSLYLKWQFKKIAVRKDYYRVPNGNVTGSRENALIYVRVL